MEPTAVPHVDPAAPASRAARCPPGASSRRSRSPARWPPCCSRSSTRRRSRSSTRTRRRCCARRSRRSWGTRWQVVSLVVEAEGLVPDEAPVYLEEKGVERVYLGYADDARTQPIGFALKGGAYGYGSDPIMLRLRLRRRRAGEILGLKVLGHKETPGHRHKIETQESFAGLFWKSGPGDAPARQPRLAGKRAEQFHALGSAPRGHDQRRHDLLEGRHQGRQRRLDAARPAPRRPSPGRRAHEADDAHGRPRPRHLAGEPRPDPDARACARRSPSRTPWRTRWPWAPRPSSCSSARASSSPRSRGSSRARSASRPTSSSSPRSSRSRTWASRRSSPPSTRSWAPSSR